MRHLTSVLIIFQILWLSIDTSFAKEKTEISNTFEFDPPAKIYNYGYEVGPSGHFHRENRGADGITYGCYGFVDETGKLRMTYYLADALGYRVIHPSQKIVVYLNDPNSKSDDPSETMVVTRNESRSWDEIMPKNCGKGPENVASTISISRPGSAGQGDIVGGLTGTVGGLLNGLLGGRPTGQLAIGLPQVGSTVGLSSPLGGVSSNLGGLPSVQLSSTVPRPGGAGQADFLGGLLNGLLSGQLSVSLPQVAASVGVGSPGVGLSANEGPSTVQLSSTVPTGQLSVGLPQVGTSVGVGSPGVGLSTTLGGQVNGPSTVQLSSTVPTAQLSVGLPQVGSTVGLSSPLGGVSSNLGGLPSVQFSSTVSRPGGAGQADFLGGLLNGLLSGQLSVSLPQVGTSVGVGSPGVGLSANEGPSTVQLSSTVPTGQLSVGLPQVGTSVGVGSPGVGLSTTLGGQVNGPSTVQLSSTVPTAQLSVGLPQVGSTVGLSSPLGGVSSNLGGLPSVQFSSTVSRPGGAGQADFLGGLLNGLLSGQLSVSLPQVGTSVGVGSPGVGLSANKGPSTVQLSSTVPTGQLSVGLPQVGTSVGVGSPGVGLSTNLGGPINGPSTVQLSSTVPTGQLSVGLPQGGATVGLSSPLGGVSSNLSGLPSVQLSSSVTRPGGAGQGDFIGGLLNGLLSGQLSVGLPQVVTSVGVGSPGSGLSANQEGQVNGPSTVQLSSTVPTGQLSVGLPQGGSTVGLSSPLGGVSSNLGGLPSVQLSSTVSRPGGAGQGDFVGLGNGLAFGNNFGQGQGSPLQAIPVSFGGNLASNTVGNILSGGINSNYASSEPNGSLYGGANWGIANLVGGTIGGNVGKK